MVKRSIGKIYYFQKYGKFGHIKNRFETMQKLISNFFYRNGKIISIKISNKNHFFKR